MFQVFVEEHMAEVLRMSAVPILSLIAVDVGHQLSVAGVMDIDPVALAAAGNEAVERLYHLSLL